MKKRKRPPPEQSEETSSTDWVGILILLAMGLLGAGAIAWGCHVQGMVWKNLLGASSCVVAGIAFVAIGIFELEWLERVIGFIDGIVSGLMQWFYVSWFGTLSESEFVGRSRARVLWILAGAISFFAGCILVFL